jgi:hypothetical protein
MRGISWLAAEPVSFSRRTLLHGVSKYYTVPFIFKLLLFNLKSHHTRCGPHALRSLTCLLGAWTLFVPVPPDVRKSIAFLKVPRYCLPLFMVRAACIWWYVWNTGGIILIKENRSTRSKTRTSATLSTTDLMWIGPSVEPGPPWREGVEKRSESWNGLKSTKFILIVCKHAVRTSKYTQSPL